MSYRTGNAGIIELKIWWAEPCKSWFFDGPSSCGPRHVRQHAQALGWTGRITARFATELRKRLAAKNIPVIEERRT
jgi:hypothetical protein